MGNLRYVTLGPERLRDTVEDRDFVTVRHMNEQLEKAAIIADEQGGKGRTMRAIRALKEKV